LIAASLFAAALLRVATAACDDPKQEAAKEAIYKIGGSVSYDPRGAYVLCQKMDDATLPCLQFIPHLWRLHMLGSRLTDAGLAKLPALKDLKELELLDADRITNRGVAHLSRLKGLESLDLSAAWVTGSGLGFLGELHNLRDLGLGVKVTFDKPEEIVGFYQNPDGTPLCPAWRYSRTTTGLEQIAKLSNLETLGLAGAQLEDADLRFLAGLRNLRVLSLGSAGLKGRGLEHLKGLTHLKTLMLPGNYITDDELRHLSGLSELEELDLSQGLPVRDVRITDKGLVHLKNLTRLRSLNLSNYPITDAGLVHLKGLRELRSLDLSGNPISDAGLVQLKGLRQLKSLRLAETRVTAAGVKVFADFPGIEVLYGNWERIVFGKLEEPPKQTSSILKGEKPR
jgi:hypothetical protein